MNAKNDLLFLIFVVVAIGIAWFVSGGPQKVGDIRPFLSPPWPLGSGTTYGENASSTLPSAIPEGQASSERGAVTITGVTTYESATPGSESITLLANRSIDITGWTLKSAVSSKASSIGEGSALPYAGQVNPQGHVVLATGGTAYIVTGRSPIGTSFRTNLCTGYFSQFQEFNPSLSLRCPRASDELRNYQNQNLSDTCINYIEGIPSCQMVVAPPYELPASCQEFITSKVNYNSCVSTHRNDSNFVENEWRIFLNENQKLWKSEREVVLLLDTNGKTVDTYSF